MKAYRFRLYPNKTQETKLYKTFFLCRYTYNKLLEELGKQDKVDRSKIQHHIVELKSTFPDLSTVYSKTLQYECYRLFSNLKGLSHSKKKGIKVGRLRFKGARWFKTIQYNQSGYKLIKTDKRYNKLKLSKIGEINIMQHREIEGNIKQITIKKRVDSWEAIIITDAKYKLTKGEKKIGIDMGVIDFLTTSENVSIHNPLYKKKSLDKLKKAHRQISRKKKRSNNRRKAIKRLLKINEMVEFQKMDFFHKVSTNLINYSRVIAIENLNIKSMVDKSKGNKYHNKRNIHDSSWGLFISMLKLKAESAGVDVIEVDPKNTTKECSKCGNIQDMPLSKRQYACNCCGFSIGRDHNSAINILAKGLGFVENLVTGSRKQEAYSEI